MEFEHRARTLSTIASETASGSRPVETNPATPDIYRTSKDCVAKLIRANTYCGNSGTSDGVARCNRVTGSLSIGRKISDAMRPNCSRTKRSLFGLVLTRYQESAGYTCVLTLL